MSCFILPPNFDGKSMSLSLQELLADRPYENIKPLNLNSASTFTNLSSDLDVDTNDENSYQSYFLTFYTKESRLQKDSQDQIIKIRNDWEKLNKKEEESKSFNSNSKSNKSTSFEKSLEASIDSRSKFTRAQMNALYKSQNLRAININDSQDDYDEEIVEEEEEVNIDQIDDDQKLDQANNDNDQSDDDSDQLDFANQSITPNNLYNTFSRRGDSYDDGFQ